MISLNEARELTPPVSPIEAMRRQLATAVFGSVSEKDVLAMTEKLKEMGMSGDLKAMKMFFDLVVGKDVKPTPPPSDAGANQVAEALRDLVDEIRVTRARSDGPASRPKQIANGVNGGDGNHD